MSPGLARIWFLLQAGIVGAWWFVLCCWPATRTPFVVGDWPEATLLLYAPADLLALVLPSLVAAAGLLRRARWANAAAMFTCGAAVYAFLTTVGALVATGSGWLAATLMLPCAAGNGLAARGTMRPLT